MGGTLLSASAAADSLSDPAPARQSLDDAWWTGPLLAASAGTLPPGHFLFEPYVFDSIPFAQIDNHGMAHDVSHENEFGSFSYFIFGVADGFSMGLIPRFGFAQVQDGKSSSTLELGDWTLQGQYKLTDFQEGGWLPTISLNIAETFPTGKFDLLDRASDGFGAGAYTSILSLYSQTYFWMPNGRLLRTRLNLSYALSNRVMLQNMSVYGTGSGFQGHADPGTSIYGDLAFEYSITRKWVAAMDFWLEQDNPTRVAGYNAGGGSLIPFSQSSGLGRELYLAPALEYNWSSSMGVIVGARIFAAGRSETALVTPVIAFNYVH
ncbi:MAG TPA: hypothetical protein VGP01_05240 [Rhizomicrobium sp.]|nr:hypothetical protein [Rhizomicrobium sp.]